MRWLAKLFGLHQVDTVLKNFNRTIIKLESAQVWHDKEAELHSLVIKRAEEAREFAQKESLRASAVAAKLRGIVGL